MKRRTILGGIWKLAVAGSILNKKLFPFDSEARDGLQSFLRNGIYVKRGNFYKKFFSEPVESALFLFADGEFFIFTSMDEQEVRGDITIIVDYLKKRGFDVKNLVLVVHNHIPIIGGFSEDDKKTYRYLVEKGFEGKFLIYSKVGKIREYKA